MFSRPNAPLSTLRSDRIGRPFPEPVAQPVADGIHVTFDIGCKVHLPQSGTQYHVVIRDLDTGTVLVDQHTHGGTVESPKHFFIRYGITVRQNYITVFHHDLCLSGKSVLIRMPVGLGLGDAIAWFQSIRTFTAKHRCKTVVPMEPRLSRLFASTYKHIKFIAPNDPLPDFYASWLLGLYPRDDERNYAPVDYRFTSLHDYAAHILGVPTSDRAPRIKLPDESRPILKPYVTIAIQASAQVKYWNNERGWDEVVGYLKGRGYRVVCLDRNSAWGCDPQWNKMPPGAEDETGERPLEERARWMRHAAFHIGVSSGLSWLAWTAGCPVVLISGWTDPRTEFATPYRVISRIACNSCWNDMRVSLPGGDWIFCPRHKGTSRELECSKKITGTQVIEACSRAITAATSL